jgi:hypothetical protein
MEMEYGQLSESSKINHDIYEYFKHISEKDRRKFVRKFREQPHDENQILHTLRELILGAYLATTGLMVEHDRKIDGKTPDWVILDAQKSPVGIVELINFRVDRHTEIDIEKQLKHPDPMSTVETDHGPIPVAVYWQPPNKERLYQRIQEKSDKYERLVKKNQLPYVVSVFGEIKAAVKGEELRQSLFEDHGGIFAQCPTLSWVLYFRESSGKYAFEFIKNSHGTIGIEIPDGHL